MGQHISETPIDARTPRSHVSSPSCSGVDEEMTNGRERSILRVVLAMAAIVVILVGVKLGAPVLGPVFLSTFFAIILMPVVGFFTRRGISHRSALALTIVLSVVVGLVMLAFVVLSIGGLIDKVTSYLNSSAQTTDLLRALLQFVATNVPVARIGSILFDGVFVLFGTLFLLIELPMLHSKMVERLGNDHPIVHGVNELYHDILDYFVVRIKVNFYTSVGATAVLLLLGIDYALLWGFLAFALSFVPYIGYLIAAVLPAAIAWTQYGWVGAVVVLALYGIINIVAENLIFPQLAGRTFAIPIFVVFVSVFFWGWMLGLAGVLLAVPLTMAAIIFFGTFEETAWVAHLLRGTRTKGKRRALLRKRE